MKKSKIIVLSALLLVAVMLLGSCDFLPFIGGKVLGMEDVVDEKMYVETGYVLSSAYEVSELEDASLIDYNGDLALFQKVDSDSYNSYTTYIVYNMAENRVVLEETEGEYEDIAIRFYSVSDYYFFTVETTTQPQYSYGDSAASVETVVYFQSGSVITSESGSISISFIMDDFVVINDEIYRVEDGSISYAFNKDSFAKTLSGDAFAETDKYYYKATYNNSGDYTWTYVKSIEVYDKGLKFVSAYNLPSYAENATALVLDNGMIFVQYMIELDSFALIYDVIDDGDKYNIVTMLVDPVSGKEDKISFDYVLRYSSQIDDEDREYTCLSDGIKNVALVCPIEDKRINESNSAMKYGTITDKGAFQAFEVIDGKVSMPGGVVAPDGVRGEKLWFVETMDGQEFLVDAKGNVKTEVTNVRQYNEEYIIADGKIYNFDLQVVYDFEEYDLSVHYVFDRSILLTGEDGEVVLFYNDRVTTIVDEGDEDLSFGGTIGSKGFYTVDTSLQSGNEYVIYNEEGDEITTFENATRLSVVRSSDKYAIISVTVSEKVGYYDTKIVTEYYNLH